MESAVFGEETTGQPQLNPIDCGAADRVCRNRATYLLNILKDDKVQLRMCGRVGLVMDGIWRELGEVR